ncbi:MAG: hypothetical protein ACFFE2_17010 [Candidatus Thorarchaeota archaeon]
MFGRHHNLPEDRRETRKTGLERKKEEARKRAKIVRESAIFTQKKHQRSLTPGVRVIGSHLLERDRGSEVADSKEDLKLAVTDYLLRKGGFQISEPQLTDTLSKKRDSEDIMEIQIARIKGMHEKWGLDRQFISRSITIFAHRSENGAIFEHSLISYGGYVSRTYYIVDGNAFRAFAQRNFRK